MGLIHLYSATSTSFDDNGTPLVTAREAVVKRDEGFQLTFNIPISQNDLHKRVQKEMIVSAMTPDGVNYFRIWDIEKRTTDVKVTALQLLYSLDVKRVNPFWGRTYTGNSVLQDFANSFKSSIAPYTFSSSITTSRSFYTNEKDDDSTSHNALAILNKITDTWSGELMLNGFDVRMVSKLGTKTDALLYEHKNIASFSDSSSMNGIVTRIYATATYTPERAEGATEDPEPVVLTATVDSPLINQYAVIYEATMEYNDARTVAELRTEILKQYSEFNVDKPERTIDVDTNIVDGTAINFGDELVLKYLVHDVDEVIRCVGYEYDPISENYIGVTLGTLEKTFLTKVTEGLTSSVTRKIDKINKQIQAVQTAANGKNRVTYGPNPVPNPIEGDLWFYHPEGRPDEIELLIYQNGLWLPAPFLTDQDKTEFQQEVEDYQNAVLAEVAQKDQEYKEIFEGYDAKVLTIDQEIEAAATKAQNALDEAGVSTDLAQTAKDLATTAKTNANTAITNANQAKADASTAATNANQAKADAQTAIADANTALENANLAKTDASKAVTDASKAVTDANTAKTNAQTAITNANTAITNANQAKTDSQTALTNANQAKEDASQALTNAGTAITNANQAKADASKAVTDASQAVEDASQALTNSGTAMTNANQAKANAQTAITDAQTAITQSGQAVASANTAKTNAQTAIDDAQLALTTAGNAKTTADTLSIKVDDLEGELELKATQTEVDGISGTVSGHTTTLSQHATQIASKAESSLVNTIKGTVDTHTTEISQNATAIASKASSASVNTLTGRVDTAESNISQNATAISQRVTTTTYNTGLATKENSVLKQSTAPSHLNGRLWLDTSVTPNVLKRSTGTAWVKATPTTASEVGAYSSDQGNTLAGRVTTAETNITQTATAITSKADKSTVDALAGTVSTQGTTITQQADLIESKADQSEVDTVKGTVSGHTTTLSQHATQIASKAEKSVVDTIKGTVDNHTTDISQNATDIATKASATSVNTLTGRVDTAESNISQNATAISQRVTTTTYNAGIASKENAVLKQTTAPTHANGRLWLDTSTTPNVLKRSTGSAWIKVTPTTASEVGAYSQSDGAGLAGRLTTAETNITQTSTAITSKADKSVVDTLSGTVSTHTTTLSQQATAISSKADKSVVDTLSGTVDNHTTDIAQNATDIATKASTSSVNTLTGRVDTAESNISQNATAISQRVTTTTYNSGIASKENTVLKQTTAPSHSNGRLWLDTSVTPNVLKRSTGTAWIKATPTTPGEVGAYSQSDGAGLAGRLTKAETNITQTATDIALKADKSVVDTLAGTVDTHTTEIAQNATAISSKASTSSVNTLTGRVNTAESNISQNATAISSKANTSTVNTLTGRVDTAESNISQNATAISQRVTTTTYNAGIASKENTVLKQSTAPSHSNGRLWLDTSVTPNILKRSTGSAWVKATPTTASEVGAYSSSQGSALAGRVTTAETNITQTSTAITSKADKSVVDALSGTVDTHTTEISQNATAIASKASTSSVNTLTGRVSTAETTIGQHATQISSKASQTEVDTVKGTVAGHTSTLSQHASQISARLTSAQVNSLVDGKGFSTVNYVDSQITASASGIRADMSVVEGKIDDLEIGGRNLLKNTGPTDGTSGWSGATIYELNGEKVFRVAGTMSETANTQLEPDQYYTTTMEIYPTVDVPINNGTPLHTYFRSSSSNNGGVGSRITLEQGSVAKANEWTKITEVVRTNQDVTTYKFHVYYPNYVNSTNPAYIRNIKLEKGNKATDWSPAPEDTMMESDFNTFKASYEATAQSLTSRITAVDKVGGRLATAETNISQNATAIATKANTSTVNTLTGRVSTAETNISQNATAIATKASTSSVNTLTGRVSTAETNISQNATAIATKASTSSVNTLTGRVSTAESNISQNATAINARLTSAQVNTLVDGKGFATQSWATTQITAKAGEITTNITSLIGRTPSQGDNLIINGGFEQWVSGSVTGGDPVGWSGVKELHTNAHSGSRALIVRTTSSTTSVTHTSLIPVTPGRRYECGFWIQSSTDANGVAGNNKLRIGSETGALVHDLTTSGPISTTSSPWVLKTTTFVVPANVYNLIVTIVHNNTVGWYKYDDVYLRDISDLDDAKSYADTQIQVKAGQITTSLTTLIDGKATQSDINTSILNYNRVKDTRSDNQLPSWYNTNYPRQTVLEFKTTSAMGITGGSTYGLLTTEVIWNHTSGGTIKQTLKDNTDTYTRQSNTAYTAWGPWVKMADQTYVNTTVTTTANGIEQLITQVKTNPTGTITGYNSLKNNVDSMVQAIGSTGGKIAQMVMSDSVFKTTVAQQSDVFKNYRIYAISYSNRTASWAKWGSSRIIRPNGSLAPNNSNNTDRSYFLYVINETGGEAHSKVYDIYTDPALATTLANDIKSFTNRQYLIFLMGSHAPTSNRTGGGLPQAIYGIGGSPEIFINEDWSNQPAYLLIGKPGLGQGRGYEYFVPASQGGSFDITIPVLNGSTPFIDSSIQAVNTQVTQLANSWALTLKSGNDIKTQINASTDSIRLASKFIHLSGSSLIDNAVIKSAMVDTLNVSKLTGTTAEFTTLRGKVITAGSITADRLVTGTALVDRVFVDTAAITRLTSKSAFITNIKAISIDVGKITGNTASFFQTAWQGLNSNVIVDSSKVRLTNSAKDFIELNGIPEVRSQDSSGTAAIMGKGRSHYYSGSQARFYIGSNLEGLAQYGVHIAKGQTWGIYRNSDTYGGTPAQYHVVVSGESWRSITTKYWNSSTSVNVLMQLNGYNVNNYPDLHPGDTVLIKAAVAGNSSGVERLWTMGTSSSGATRLYSHPEHIFEYRIEVHDRARFIAKALFENSFTNNSDRRIKHDIKDTEVRALDHLDSLTFKEYKLNATGAKVPLGLIAQDSGILRVKGEDESDYEGIDGLLMPMLAMKGVQELHAIVKAQAEKIRQLEEIINQ